MNIPNSPTEFLICSTIFLLDILPIGCTLYSSTILIQWLSLTYNLHSFNFIPSISTNHYLTTYSILESVFWIFSIISSLPIFNSTKLMQETEISNESRRGLFEETINSLNGKNKKEVDIWLKGWFYTEPEEFSLKERIKSFFHPLDQDEIQSSNIEEEEVKRGNVEELLCGIFFNSPLSNILFNPIKNHNLISMINQLEIARNFKFKSGYNSNLKPLCSNLLSPNMVKSEHRPLILYLSMGFLQGLFGWIMWFVGFQQITYKLQNGEVGEKGEKGEKGKLEGWYHHGLTDPSSGIICYLYNSFFTSKSEPTTNNGGKTQTKSNQKLQPIIFIPGLAGPFFLTHLIVHLVFSLNRPILIIDQHHLSLKLRLRWNFFKSNSNKITDLPNLSKCVIKFFESKGYNLVDGNKPMIVAHSLGSALASSLVRCTSLDKGLRDNLNMKEEGNHEMNNQDCTTKSRLKLVLLDPISILITNSHLSRTIYLPSSTYSSSSSFPSSSPSTFENGGIPKGSMNRLIQYFIREKGMIKFLINDFNPFDSFLPISKISKLNSNLISNLNSISKSDFKLDENIKVNVVLSRNDHLLPISEIENYLKRNKVDYEVLENIQHGQWLINVSTYLIVWKIIKESADSEEQDLGVQEGSKVSQVQVVSHEHTKDKIINQNFTSPIIPIGRKMGLTRTRSKSFIITPTPIISESIRSPSKLSCIKMGRNRSRTVSFSPHQYTYPDNRGFQEYDYDTQQHPYEIEFSMSRQCSSIGMNRTLNVSRFKIVGGTQKTIGVWN